MQLIQKSKTRKKGWEETKKKNDADRPDGESNNKNEQIGFVFFFLFPYV